MVVVVAAVVAGAAVVAAAVVGASVAAAVVPAESLLSLPHAAATSANSVSGTRSPREVRFMGR